MKRHPEGTKVLSRCSQLNLTFNQVECSEKQTEWPKEQQGPLAQLVEQRTFNPRVAGSSPVRPTRDNQRYQSPSQRYQSPSQKYQVLKNQSAQLWGAGSLFACPRQDGFIIVFPTALTSFLPTPSNTKLNGLTLPKYVMEVVP